MDTNNIGGKIATARKNANLSQAQLGQQMFISAQAVGKWERGESIPDIVTVSRLAEILGVDLNYFSDNAHSINEASVSDTHIEPPVVPVEALAQNHARTAARTVHHIHFSGSNLTKSDFAGITARNRTFTGSALRGSNFSQADLAGSKFSSSDMQGCIFDGADLTECTFLALDLSEARFDGAMLVGTEISKCGLDRAQFSNVEFSDVKLTKADLRKTVFENCVFRAVDFSSSDLSGVNLDGQNFDCVKFHNTGLKGASFKGATLNNVSFRAPLAVTNRYYKAIQTINFEGAKMDKLSYAALKGLGVDLSAVAVITDR